MKKLFAILLVLGSVVSYASVQIEITGIEARKAYKEMNQVHEEDYGYFKEKKGNNIRCNFHKGASGYPDLYQCYFNVNSQGAL